MTRYYHFYSDTKTVKKLDWPTWREYAMLNFHTKNKKLLCRVHRNEIYFTHGHGITIPLRQLKEALKE